TEEAAEADLRRRVRELALRTRRLAARAPLTVPANPGFELPESGERIPGWLHNAQRGVTIELRAREQPPGGRAVDVKSTGPVASLVSDWFEMPATGRLAIEASLATPDGKRQPPLRVAIELAGGASYYRYSPIGAPPAHIPLTEPWAPYVFPFEDLPVAKGTRARVRFDLMGAGQASIDDVRVLDLVLSEGEQVGLAKIVSLTDLQLREGKLAQCAYTLEGFWPRYLARHVPLDEDRQARRTEPVAKPAAAPKSDTPDRVIDRLKKLKPF
ncbi:MAG: hypothetical protein WD176_00475, partial [Pirellulales bacterium]